MEPVIGIDLGTRYSCSSIWRNNKFEIIPDQFGNRTIPSVVSFFRSAKLVGNNALSLKEVNPANTIYDIKRIIGRRMDDPVIEQVKKLITYKLTHDRTEHKNIMVKLDNEDGKLSHKTRYRPEEICAQILLEIKRTASKYLDHNVTKCVVTVPAYFNDSQRQATLDAAKIAGLDVIKIINEPTAASLAYGMGNKKWNSDTGGNVIIYDLGAGTLDVSLMNINNGLFRTLAVGGNTHLGGEDIDLLLMNQIMIEFRQKHHIKNLDITKLAQLKLKNSVETAKKILSTNDSAVVCVDNFYQGHKLYHVLTRQAFEMICNELFIMCIRPLFDVLTSANMTKDDIDDVILVGGSTRIPKIQLLIKEFFKHTRIKHLTMSLNPDEVVSTGAAIYGHVLTHKNDPFSENLVLLDIIPLSLGVETLRKQMTTIIPRNTIIPTRKTKVFSTDSDNQDTVSIKIFEGERKLTKYNFHVGTFDLAGFEKGPRGYPIIRITFHVDINGILNVTALEKRSNVKNTIEITSTWGAKGRLSTDEIDKMLADAEKNEFIDNIYSVKIGYIHTIRSTCETVLANIGDESFCLTKSDVKKIRKYIRSTLKWIDSKELTDFTVDDLKSRCKNITKMYTPLIVQISKNKGDFKDISSQVGTEIYGDDELTEETRFVNPLDYENEEIKKIKETIMNLCQDILNVVNNPVSNIDPIDVELFTDYLDSVRIWLFTTSSKTAIEFSSKIKEVNDFTDELMKKYTDETMFEKSSSFTTMDELKLTCQTLNNCITSNFFTLDSNHLSSLTKKLDEINSWISENPNADDRSIRDKIFDINEICNNIYSHSIAVKLLPEEPVSDSDSDEEDVPVNPIKENIQSVIDSMPNKVTRKPKVLVKIDLDKLAPTKINYKSVR